MSEFVESLADVFEEFGFITSRRMFGGYGIYHDGLMFGLIADDELYLKVDELSKFEFEAKDLPAFEYSKNGKIMKMSYHLAPDEIYDDKHIACDWAMKAFEAALRSDKKKKKRI